MRCFVVIIILGLFISNCTPKYIKIIDAQLVRDQKYILEDSLYSMKLNMNEAGKFLDTIINPNENDEDYLGAKMIYMDDVVSIFIAGEMHSNHSYHAYLLINERDKTEIILPNTDQKKNLKRIRFYLKNKKLLPEEKIKIEKQVKKMIVKNIVQSRKESNPGKL